MFEVKWAELHSTTVSNWHVCSGHPLCVCTENACHYLGRSFWFLQVPASEGKEEEERRGKKKEEGGRER